MSILSIATAVPRHAFTPADATNCLKQVMALPPERQQAVESIFEHALVERRYSPFPVEHFARPRSLSQGSREYREHAIALGRRVVSDCLDEARVTPDAVDFLITVSCTGVMLPSLDAYLVNELGFRRDVRRLPITELGCAAGAAALARACDFLKAYPAATALVVSVELPTLTFQAGDVSMANLISCALFGDGAAAALLRAPGLEGPGIQILGSESHLVPDSYEALGFELQDGGLHIVLGKQLPAMVRRHLRDVVDRFLARHGLSLDALSFLVLHPGGRKLIEAIEEELNLERAQTLPTWEVLRNYGNLSSASVFFVLREWLSGRPRRPGAPGLMVAFGPGFSIELLLLRWS